MVYTSSSAKPNSLLTKRLAHTYRKLIFILFFLNSLTVCRMPGIPKPVTFPNTNQLFNSHNWRKKLKQNNQFSVSYFKMPFCPILDVQIRHKGQKAVSFLSQTWMYLASCMIRHKKPTDKFFVLINFNLKNLSYLTIWNKSIYFIMMKQKHESCLPDCNSMRKIVYICP